jgi:hypothetical protein
MAVSKFEIVGFILCFIVLWGMLIWKWSEIYKNKKSTTFDKFFQTLLFIVACVFLILFNLNLASSIFEEGKKNAMVAVTGGLPAVNNAAKQVAAVANAGNNAAAAAAAAAAKQVAAVANAGVPK